MNSKEIGISAISGIIKVIVIIILLVVFVRLGQVGYDYGYQVFNQKAVSTGEGKSVTVTIKEGESIAELANDLKEKGLIEDATLFRVQEFVSDNHNKEKAGTYTVTTAMKPDEMLAVFSPKTEEKKEDGKTEVPTTQGEAGTGSAEGEDMSEEGNSQQPAEGN